MDQSLELFDTFTEDLALELLQAQLDVAGVTDPSEREDARRLVVNYFRTQRAATEAVGAVKH